MLQDAEHVWDLFLTSAWPPLLFWQSFLLLVGFWEQKQKHPSLVWRPFQEVPRGSYPVKHRFHNGCMGWCAAWSWTWSWTWIWIWSWIWTWTWGWTWGSQAAPPLARGLFICLVRVPLSEDQQRIFSSFFLSRSLRELEGSLWSDWNDVFGLSRTNVRWVRSGWNPTSHLHSQGSQVK